MVTPRKWCQAPESWCYVSVCPTPMVLVPALEGRMVGRMLLPLTLVLRLALALALVLVLVLVLVPVPALALVDRRWRLMEWR